MNRMYVYSTLASDVAYTNHEQGGADLPIALPAVLIKGGAGVANERLVTPRGVVTEVTESDVEYLRKNPVFLMHEKNGFVEISAGKVDPDIAAADMTGRDNSAPIVDEDLPTDGRPTGSEPADSPQAPPAPPSRGRGRK